MTDKDTTVTTRISSTTEQQLPDHINKSSLLRELLVNYIRVGDSVEVSLRRKINDVEDEIESKRIEKTQIENEISRLERELDELQSKLKRRQEHTPEEVIKFAERVSDGKFPHPEPENEAVKTWAQKAGIKPEKFVQEVEDRL